MVRKQKREMQRAIAKLNKHIKEFIKVAYFDDATLDFNAITKMEFTKINTGWKSWCQKRKYVKDVENLFNDEIRIMRIDLILKEKYGITVDKNDVIDLVYNKTTPEMEVAEIIFNRKNK